MTLSDDLGKRVVETVVVDGLSRNAAAKLFKVSVASAVRRVKQFETTGDVSPKPLGGDHRSGRIEAHHDYRMGLIRRTPDITLLEIQERLIRNCDERFSSSVLWRFFDRHGVTLKKNRAHRRAAALGRAETPPRMVRGTAYLNPSKLVFIDETGALTNLARKGGRCRRGRRLRAAVPHGHYKTVTLVAGIDLRGIAAQKVFDRPINAALFEEWVEKLLVPTLSNGDIVVMDNLSSHKGPRVEELIKGAGAELRYLPPYSPDMNPIEKAFSKLKAHLRKIAERSVAGLMRALETCAEIFKPAEWANYFAGCGYDTT
jgi:transposase